MSATEVALVRTGSANVASVLAAFARLGVGVKVVRHEDDVINASHVVVPGVGAFGGCMAELQRQGLVQALHHRVQQGQRATLGICLGMQLFCQGSEEAPGIAGIGAVHGMLRRFAAPVRTPHLGWNELRPQSGCRMLTAGYVYFAHSYRLEEVPPGWHATLSQHGGPFVAALERGPMVLCQFHPELSGPLGAALLQQWVGL